MPDGGRFGGRVAVVTGAASGLGRATAEVIAGDGAQLTVDEIKAAGGNAIAVRTDVSDPESVATAMKEVVSQLGVPNTVCNVAGIGKFAHTVEASFDDWQRILAVNLTG